MNRFRIQIVGESGSGLLSTGEILSQALHKMGYFLVSDREYPSLIRGGHSCFSLNISDQPVRSLSENSDLMIMLDKNSLQAYHARLADGGILVHGYDRVAGLQSVLPTLTARNVEIFELRAREMAETHGGTVLMTNVILLGAVWKLLGFPLEILEAIVHEQFAHKPKLLEIDLKCVRAGYESTQSKLKLFEPRLTGVLDATLIDGAKALTLGAIHAGVRAYFAYPMSPSSTILTHMADLASKTGVLVKQAEDEITAAQMALGAMFMGTRAFTATSGGGFDLMTESISLAGMIENPWVCVVAQRPGPATGLPTWTAQGDYTLARYAGHGEFPRIVMSASDSQDAFTHIQHAFNWAERFQVPVVVLTEKVIAESIWTTPRFKEGAIPIERGLVAPEDLATLQNKDRFAMTENGISKRWLPGQTEAYYFANGDEHSEDGSLNEDSPLAADMISKRLRKIQPILEAIPEPEVFGPTTADISFVGWGSSKNAVLDAAERAKAQGKTVNYLHYSVLHPLKTEALRNFIQNNPNLHFIEGSHDGAFGIELEHALNFKFKGKLLKWDGRPFFTEDLDSYLQKNA